MKGEVKNLWASKRERTVVILKGFAQPNKRNAMPKDESRRPLLRINLMDNKVNRTYLDFCIIFFYEAKLHKLNKGFQKFAVYFQTATALEKQFFNLFLLFVIFFRGKSVQKR